VKAEQTGELYNLEEDLSEKRNLVTEKPEQVEQMKQLLESLILKGRSTLGSNQKNDVRVTRYPKTSS
jgi:hypothetical protein